MFKFWCFVVVYACQLLLLTLSWSAIATSALLVGSAIIPHGDYAWDPTLAPPGTVEREAANQVASAARLAGAWLYKTMAPDLIILSTPHGISVSHDWAWYLASHASGHADIGQDAPEHKPPKKYRIRAAINMAPNVTEELMTYLKAQAVTGLLNFADSEDMALRWGEVVPILLLLNESSTTSTTSLTTTSQINTNKRPRFVIVSHPLRRHSQAPQMIPELLKLGRSLRQWADTSPMKVAILISADLSHRHLASGPYGYSETSALMDAALGRWASNPWLHADELLVTAASLQNDALACGFTGMVMMHGALVVVGSQNNQDDHIPQQSDDDDDDDQTSLSSHWESRVLVNRNVTYYGMMAATFENRRKANAKPYPSFWKWFRWSRQKR